MLDHRLNSKTVRKIFLKFYTEVAKLKGKRIEKYEFLTIEVKS